MAIAMPGEDRLVAGPRRDLVEAFHGPYTEAGRPGTRALVKAISADNTLPVHAPSADDLVW